MKQKQSADLKCEAGDIIMMCNELPGDDYYARELARSAATQYVKRLRCADVIESRRK